VLSQWWAIFMPILPSVFVIIWAALGIATERPPRHVDSLRGVGGKPDPTWSGHAPKPRPAPKHRRKEG
jgi:hypothetical protein